MKQGIQKEISNNEVRLYGCYFLDCLQAAGKDYSEDSYDEAITKGFMTKDCTVLAAHQLIGTRKTTIITTDQSKIGKGDILIYEMQKPGHSGSHFVLEIGNTIQAIGDLPKYESIWDPLGKRPEQQGYIIKSYRVIK
jgi:hypothetical protein